MEEKRQVYLDYSATTPVKQEVVDEMIPYFTEKFGNASAIYSTGAEAKDALENARARVAALINAEPREIVFTSGGTESDNWALIAMAKKLKNKGCHIITSNIEHHAVLHTCEYLARKEGFEITYVGVNPEGIVDPAEVEAAIRPDTILISIMHVNNEVGSVQPVKEIGAIARARGIFFHTDAVQAAGNVPIDVKEMNIDMLSLSSHKIYGPKGAGALYIRTGVILPTYIHGGAQERKRRAGTENIPGIVGMAKAVELAMANQDETLAHIKETRDYLVDRIMKEIPYTRLNGHKDLRLPGNANFSFQFVEGESLLIMLDMEGICGSSGSACTAGSLDPSHVLMAIGLPHEIAHGSLRLTLGEENTKEEMDFVVEKLKAIVQRLRDMSPLYEDFIKKSQAK